MSHFARRDVEMFPLTVATFRYNFPCIVNMAGLLCLKVFAACVNFPTYETSQIRIFVPPRREERQVRINIISFSLRPLRPFDLAQGMLYGGNFDSFGCGSAALAFLALLNSVCRVPYP